MSKTPRSIFSALFHLLAFLTSSVAGLSRVHGARRRAFAHIVAIFVIIILILVILIILTI